MLLNHFNLRDQPFGVTPDPRYLFLTSTHRAALERLLYGIDSGLGFMALTAEPGMGKTTLMHVALNRLGNTARTAFLFQAITGPDELFRALLIDLGEKNPQGTLIELEMRLNEILLKYNESGQRVVVVLDEAQNLDDSVLEAIRMLSNFETSRHKLLQVILCGQRQLADRLAAPELVQLRQRISIFATLKPLTRLETANYIEHRLKVAGYENSTPLFTREAVSLIAHYADGIPRNINNICFNSLSIGCALGKKVIDAEVVRETIVNLGLDGSKFAEPTDDSDSQEARFAESTDDSGSQGTSFGEPADDLGSYGARLVDSTDDSGSQSARFADSGDDQGPQGARFAELSDDPGLQVAMIAEPTDGFGSEGTRFADSGDDQGPQGARFAELSDDPGLQVAMIAEPTDGVGSQGARFADSPDDLEPPRARFADSTDDLEPPRARFADSTADLELPKARFADSTDDLEPQGARFADQITDSEPDEYEFEDSDLSEQRETSPGMRVALIAALLFVTALAAVTWNVARSGGLHSPLMSQVTSWFHSSPPVKNQPQVQAPALPQTPASPQVDQSRQTSIPPQHDPPAQAATSSQDVSSLQSAGPSKTKPAKDATAQASSFFGVSKPNRERSSAKLASSRIAIPNRGVEVVGARKGQSFAGICVERFNGCSMTLLNTIVELNPGIKDRDHLQAGQRVVLPVIESRPQQSN